MPESRYNHDSRISSGMSLTDCSLCKRPCSDGNDIVACGTCQSRAIAASRVNCFEYWCRFAWRIFFCALPIAMVLFLVLLWVLSPIVILGVVLMIHEQYNVWPYKQEIQEFVWEQVGWENAGRAASLTFDFASSMIR